MTNPVAKDREDVMQDEPVVRPPHDARERFRLGLRVALEEMMVGRDYARVETILRELSRDAESNVDSEAPGN
jgi:hypothetical protein